jgi:signal transduction histidine kinase
VAHDFNNMLRVILGHTALALDEVDPAQAIFADLQEVHKAAERSAELTRQLLAFARKQTVAPKLIDLNETAEDEGWTVEAEQPLAGGQGGGRKGPPPDLVPAPVGTQPGEVVLWRAVG